MIELKNLELSFGDNLFFSNLSIELEKGKLHSLRGKNGSGKSTLFKALRGDVEKSQRVSGSIVMGGVPYELAKKQERVALQKQVAMLTQSFDAMIADQFSFKENLAFANYGRSPIFDRTKGPNSTLPAFIERFGINPDLPAHRLSGGQRQILALLMLLQKNPVLLLLDEPTAALDSVNAKLVFEFIHEIIKSKDLTVLTICHDLDLIHQYCNGRRHEIVINPQTKLRYLL